MLIDIQHRVHLQVENSLPNNAKHQLAPLLVLMRETCV
jgi:hypothetical protein